MGKVTFFSKADADKKYTEFRKKPVMIRAKRMNAPFIVRTLEGEMQGDTGDWLVEGIEDELYPCKHNIFVKTYERIK